MVNMEVWWTNETVYNSNIDYLMYSVPSLLSIKRWERLQSPEQRKWIVRKNNLSDNVVQTFYINT